MKWEGLPSHDNTWEYVTHIHKYFPRLNLEDKANFHGGGIVLVGEQEKAPINITEGFKPSHMHGMSLGDLAKFLNTTSTGD